jgi:hypothetical protein
MCGGGVERLGASVAEYLASLDTEQIADWLHLFLRYGISTPAQLAAGDDWRATVFTESVWDHIESVSGLDERTRRELKLRIKEAAAELVLDWTAEGEDERYLRELLILVGGINCHGCLDSLLDLAGDGSLAGVGDDDLHRELLAVAFSVHLSRNEERAKEQAGRIRALVDLYIDVPEYSAVAFDKAWQIDREASAEYVRRYVKASMGDPVQDVEDTLIAFQTGTGAKYLEERFPEIRAALLRESRYAASAVPRAYYERYVRSISRLCTFELRVPLASRFDRELLDVLTETEGNSQEEEEPQLIVKWHPPYRASQHAEFPTAITIEPVDFRVLGIRMPSQRELTARLHAAIERPSEVAQ